MNRKNYNWLAASSVGQGLSVIWCIMYAVNNSRYEALVPAAILAASSVVTVIGWTKLEIDEDARVGYGYGYGE